MVGGIRRRMGVGDWKREEKNLTLWEVAKANTDWLVVVGRRPVGRSRAIVDQDEFQKYIEEIYGRSQVVSFWGNQTVYETVKLFQRTLLYIAPHGAGMTNVIFMKSGAAVLEIMPIKLVNPCYHFLSDRCKLDYYLLYGNGNFTSPLEANFTQVGELAKTILPPRKALID